MYLQNMLWKYFVNNHQKITIDVPAWKSISRNLKSDWNTATKVQPLKHSDWGKKTKKQMQKLINFNADSCYIFT